MAFKVQRVRLHHLLVTSGAILAVALARNAPHSSSSERLTSPSKADEAVTTPDHGPERGTIHLHKVRDLVETSSPGAGAASGAAPMVPAMFGFGDANVDTGNNDQLNGTLLRNDFPPLGRSYFGQPSGRASDGRLVIDFLAQYLGLPMLSPNLDPTAQFQKGANFASGGATASASLSIGGQSIPFPTQVQNFLDFRMKAGSDPRFPSEEAFKNGLYVIQIGEVDFLTAFIAAGSIPFQGQSLAARLVPGVQEGIINATQTAITTLYGVGARRFIVFAPYPLGCLPYMRARYLGSGETCVTDVWDYMMRFNEILGTEIASLRTSLAGSSLLYVRSDKVLNLAIRKPESMGLNSTLDACCGSGTYNGIGPCGLGQYTVCPQTEHTIYWDWLHNSEALFNVVATTTWRGTTEYVEPQNLSEQLKSV